VVQPGRVQHEQLHGNAKSCQTTAKALGTLKDPDKEPAKAGFYLSQKNSTTLREVLSVQSVKASCLGRLSSIPSKLRQDQLLDLRTGLAASVSSVAVSARICINTASASTVGSLVRPLEH
jgi:hypothetical protein